MLKEDVFKFFGSIRKTAEALEVTYQCVNAWGIVVPPKQAMKIFNLSKGVLKIIPALYK